MGTSNVNHNNNDKHDKTGRAKVTLHEIKLFWLRGPEQIRSTMPLILECDPSLVDIGDIGGLWGNLIRVKGAGGDVDSLATQFMDWVRPLGQDMMSELLVGEKDIFMTRAVHIRDAVLLIIDWHEKRGEDETNILLIDKSSRMILKQANRLAPNEGVALIEKILPYRDPRVVTTHNRSRSWAREWASESFDLVSGKVCGEEVLDVLCRWGIDLDAVDRDGMTTLEQATRQLVDLQINGNGSEADQLSLQHTVDTFIARGADWKEIMERPHMNEDVKTLLRKHPVVRREMLGNRAEKKSVQGERSMKL